MQPNYDRLRELLQNECFPTRYTHKFIGIKSTDFETGLLELERLHPQIKRVSQRESAKSGAVVYLAVTYEFIAENPEEIIEILKSTTTIKDIKVLL